jgi:AcrR family transcriptional regulator
MSARRTARPAETRREILASSRRLFAVRGYRGTKITDIAADAGVSPQTIYNSVGSKSDLLAGIVDSMEDEVGIEEFVEWYNAATVPADLVALQLELARRFVERTGDIVRALHGGTGEPELLGLREEGRTRHRAGCRVLIDKLDAMGAIASSRERAELADVAALLSDSETVIVLVDNYGWELGAAIDYLTELLGRELLGERG